MITWIFGLVTAGILGAWNDWDHYQMTLVLLLYVIASKATVKSNEKHHAGQ